MSDKSGSTRTWSVVGEAEGGVKGGDLKDMPWPLTPTRKRDDAMSSVHRASKHHKGFEYEASVQEPGRESKNKPRVAGVGVALHQDDWSSAEATRATDVQDMDVQGGLEFVRGFVTSTRNTRQNMSLAPAHPKSQETGMPARSEQYGVGAY